MYACEIYACEMHAYEMHAHEMYAHEIHACQMLPGIPLFLGAFLPFPGTLKQFLGISIAPRTSSVFVRAWVLTKHDFESSTGPTWTDLTWSNPNTIPLLASTHSLFGCYS